MFFFAIPCLVIVIAAVGIFAMKSKKSTPNTNVTVAKNDTKTVPNIVGANIENVKKELEEAKITLNIQDAEEVKEMVHIAHEEGMAVMSHTNGDYGVQAAVKAGVDSLEHGNYMNEESLAMLAQSNTVWVPTLVTVRNLMGDGRYEDEVLRPIIENAEANIRKAFQLGIKVAPGSDAGAYRVLHGQGIQDEIDSFVKILEEHDDVYCWLENGEEEIKKKFVRL